MQSSLTTILSSALGYSPHPPVSVYGTVTLYSPRGAFLGSMGSLTISASLDLEPHHLSVLTNSRFNPRSSTYRLEPGRPSPGLSYPSPSPLASMNIRRRRNINLLSITYGLSPRLRNRLTLGGLSCPRNPWVFGEQVSRLFYRYSCWHNHS